MIDNLVKRRWARSKAAVNDRLFIGGGFARVTVSDDVCLPAGKAASVAERRRRVGQVRSAQGPARASEGAGGRSAVLHVLVAGSAHEDAPALRPS